jgi:hypothetical protein
MNFIWLCVTSPKFGIYIADGLAIAGFTPELLSELFAFTDIENRSGDGDSINVPSGITVAAEETIGRNETSNAIKLEFNTFMITSIKVFMATPLSFQR